MHFNWCTPTRVAPNLIIEECVRSLKWFIVRLGRLKEAYLDNGMTFVAGANWLRKTVKDELLDDWPAKLKIVLQFNLTRAPPDWMANSDD